MRRRLLIARCACVRQPNGDMVTVPRDVSTGPRRARVPRSDDPGTGGAAEVIDGTTRAACCESRPASTRCRASPSRAGTAWVGSSRDRVGEFSCRTARRSRLQQRGDREPDQTATTGQLRWRHRGHRHAVGPGFDDRWQPAPGEFSDGGRRHHSEPDLGDAHEHHRQRQLGGGQGRRDLHPHRHAADPERHVRPQPGFDRRWDHTTPTASRSSLTQSSPTVCRAAVAKGIDPESHHNLDDDNTCGLTVPNGDKPNTEPLLGLLADNGGQTATHALSPLSPAINAGDSASCTPTDQRGAARPAGGCDIGAFEYVTPTLTVATSVINDDGGTPTAGGFNVHVRAGGADVAGSPQPGTRRDGRTRSPRARTTSPADPVPGYTLAVGGACWRRRCGRPGREPGRRPAPSPRTTSRPPTLPPPVAGKSVNVLPKSGTVRIRRPGASRFRG